MRRRRVGHDQAARSPGEVLLGPAAAGPDLEAVGHGPAADNRKALEHRMAVRHQEGRTAADRAAAACRGAFLPPPPGLAMGMEAGRPVGRDGPEAGLARAHQGSPGVAGLARAHQGSPGAAGQGRLAGHGGLEAGPVLRGLRGSPGAGPAPRESLEADPAFPEEGTGPAEEGTGLAEGGTGLAEEDSLADLAEGNLEAESPAAKHTGSAT